jgi:hypothetical protein
MFNIEKLQFIYYNLYNEINNSFQLVLLFKIMQIMWETLPLF